jgi:putative aminopeptidase FrvX
MNTDGLLSALLEAEGVSGHEQAARDAVRLAWSPHCHDVRSDVMGSLVASRWSEASLEAGPSGRESVGDRDDSVSPRSPSILLASHMDQIGLMVTKIETGGFIRFTTVGGWDPRVLLAQPIRVHGQSVLPGVIGSRPPHVLGPELRGLVIPIDELFIDIGLAEDEVRRKVRVGDVISLARAPQKLQGKRRASPSMDNRASVAAVAICLELLSQRRHVWDVHAVATVQEEIGLKGAKTAAWGLSPTMAIAIDVSFAAQSGASDIDFKLGDGPLIAFGPNIHPAIHEALVEAATRLEMKHAIEPIAGDSGTDAWATQVARSGVPTGLLSIPMRYMHSPVETLSLEDIERVGRLLAEFIAGLSQAFADRLTYSLDGEAANDSGSAT